MNELRRLRPLLGTYVEVGVSSGSGDANTAVCAAFAALQDVQRRLSFQDPHSELTRLNQSGPEGLALHPDSARVLRLALAMSERSAGLFNCTVGGALVRGGHLPDHRFGARLESGEAADVMLAGIHARLRRPVLITLDGIAKGHAVDRAVRALRLHGATAGWVNAGGDLRVFGERARVIHLRGADGVVQAIGHLRNGAMAGSHAGSAAPGGRFPARLVPAKGRAVRAGVWAVLARFAWKADALAKIAGQLGEEGHPFCGISGVS